MSHEPFLVEHTLGLEAFAYFREYLCWGHTLSARLLELPLESGVVTTFAPPGIPEEHLDAFEEGSLTMEYTPSPVHSPEGGWWQPVVNTAELDPQFYNLIDDYLRETPNHWAIFEERLGTASDEWLQGCSLPFVTQGDELYFFIPPGERSRDHIRSVVKQARGFTLTGVLTCLPGDMVLTPRSTIDLHTLQTAAQNCRNILLSAYDGEGYLIWSRG